MVIRAGTTSVDALIGSFDVSPMTLYRDLAALESRHVLTRSRGEVTAIASSLSETPVEFRSEQEVEEKSRIGQVVAGLIDQYSSIFIDDSTTSAHVIPHLTSTHQKTFMTNSLGIAKQIAQDLPYKEIILVGGSYIPNLNAAFGSEAESQFATLAPQSAIIGAAAADTRTIFHPIAEAASFKRMLIPQVSTTILAMTASKLTRTALFKVADIADFTSVVVDSSAPEPIVEELKTQTQVFIA